MPMPSLLTPLHGIPRLMSRKTWDNIPLATRKVKCLTLNVLASPVPFNRMEGERLACLLHQINEQQYDVVAFQELVERHWSGVSRKRRYKEFVTSLHDLGYLHQVTGPAPRRGAHLDGGIAIFSKHKIISSSTHPWREQVSWDAWASKGILRALIEVPPPENMTRALDWPPPSPARLHMLTLHAQASHVGWQNTSGENKYRSIRLQQMQQLRDVVRDETGDGEAVLAVGDFNFDARDLQELSLHQAMLANGTGRSRPPVDVLSATFDGDHPVTYGARNAAGGPNETFLTCKGLRTSEQCLDHVYYWPAEPWATGHPDIASGHSTGLAHSGRAGFVLGQPRCDLEVCPYTGPTSGIGRRPTQISDHFGWAVEFELAWRRPVALAHAEGGAGPWPLARLFSPLSHPVGRGETHYPAAFCRSAGLKTHPVEALKPVRARQLLKRMWHWAQTPLQKSSAA
mmetsp:Transcript_97503/g.271244  ORF Transcript_97503/g.271244 Transcript_97503/m.271244 type:complete len:456 (-) Transcript_97503:40-1407(-)